MNRNRFNNLSGGSRSRLQRMRQYAQRWNTDESKKARGIDPIDWREARTFGIGSISVDAHGPNASDSGNSIALPSSITDGWRDAGECRSGWYADAYQDETYTGRAWQLPTPKSGELLFVAGYVERDSGYSVLSATRGRLDYFDSKEDALRAADRLAERSAEREREYSERANEAMRLDDKESEALDNMHAARSAWRIALRGWIDAKACGARDAITACRDAMERQGGRFADAMEDVRNVRAKLSDYSDVER